MKLVTFTVGGKRARLGALMRDGEWILDFCSAAVGIPAPEEYLDCFDMDGGFLSEARSLYERARRDEALVDELREENAVLRAEAVQLMAPVMRPGKILCIGLNYKDHAAESQMPLPDRPLLFSKFPTATTGPGSPVRIPHASEKVDFEAELAVVIGRRACRVALEDAYDHVLGYANFNDVSARDFQFDDGQWQRGKSCDTFAPLGPFIATTAEIPDPHSLGIRLRLNGETMQDSNTDQLIFGVGELIAALSESATLEPGDVIATGTPPGVGFARKPPVYLRPGDRMEVEIEGLGVLANPVVGAA